ncbi:MAG: glycosyl hydrolase 108 family protein [Pseudohongiellaceae bacterium]|nr:glycosyl hydrolase 108 family protein [Pseudohongiellaceae bacterium]
MSASAFITALQETLRKEGRLSNNVADSGGITDYGISLRFLKLLPLIDADVTGDGHVNEDDIRALEPSIVAKLYRKYFWDYYRLDEIMHDRIAIKAFDMLVNMRSVVAAKCMQRALRACAITVKEDGIIGTKTIDAINEIRDYKNLLTAMRSESFGIYQLIAAKDPSQQVFLQGWKNRAYS